ncbi:1-phosphatidylinositol 3-phosphate 5-kinase fab1 [Phytophthora cinnamomi]|uniref:1-phosphatidylinositol 3-phosphate 5-kinase fab1 n=1 Tax=Phytophthora cinnamomi TaxID=4785 RepID=UPI0035595535|nr:1-phosphatidylinositol 3-phosphate 5-kinase fab1 [Phytophthora cinnamomi]
MASEVMQRASYRTSGSDIHRHVSSKSQELWSGLQQRLGATPMLGGVLGNQKGERVLEDSDSDEDEGDDTVQDRFLPAGACSVDRVRCRSAASSDGRDTVGGRLMRVHSEDSALLSAAQKAGCFSYIKRRHSIALAFASNDHVESTVDDIREPSNISPLEECDMVGSNWEAAKVKNGVHLFKSKRSRCEVRGVTQVNASVKNVMSILAAGDTTERFAEAQKIILGADQVIEAKVLASCAQPTNSRFFHCGLKYQAMKNPFGTTPLDLVYLDYTDVSTTNDGKLIGYRIIESIRVPELRPSPKYVRASIRCEVYTVQETDTPGVVEVTFASHLDPKSKCSSSRRSHWLEQAGVRLANLRAHAEKTSIGNHLVTEARDMYRKHRSFTSGDKDKQQRNCNVCQHAFSFLRKRHSCRLCGEMSCGRCCRKMPVLVGAETTRVKVCLSCILHSRNNPDEIRRGELGQPTRRRDISNSTFVIYDE